MNCSIFNTFNVSLILILLSTTVIAGDSVNSYCNKRPSEDIESASPVKRLHTENVYFYKPLNELVELANNNDKMAQYYLDLMHDNDAEVTVNFNSAFEKTANQFYLQALFNLGQLYLDGKGTEKDPKKAYEYIKYVADQGYPEAQQTLALLYFQGLGIEKNIDKALEYYQKAADQGCLQSKHNLGHLYFDNEGVEKDLIKAFENCQKAADQGQPESQYQLGQLYFEGKGTKKVDKKAFEYYKKAAAQGHHLAQFKLGQLFYAGLGTKKDLKRARECYQQAADQGYPEAQFNLGMCYFNGHGTKKNSKKAFEYIKKSANQGHSEALHKLGEFYYTATGTEKDDKEAFEYFQKATDKGHIGSQFTLGTFYKYGNGIKKDFNKALEYFQKAANQGMAKAEWSIGHLYEIGDGTKKNLLKAIEMYMKASKKNQPDAIEDVNRFMKIANDQLPILQGIENNIKAYREAIHTFKSSHAAAAQEWKLLAEHNNHNSNFKNSFPQITYLYNLYKDLAEIHFNIGLIAERFLDPSFMINCVQFVHHEFNTSYNSSPQNYIKRYDIIPKVNINAPSYTTFGIQNIEYHNMLIRLIQNLNTNESFQKVENLHNNALKKLTELAYSIYVNSNKSENERENNLKKICEINSKIENEKKYIMYLNNLKQIPNILMRLAVKGTMIRNHLFAKEYEHIGKI